MSKMVNKNNMAIGVDTSKWKPRKLKGTPAVKARNKLAFGVLAFGVVSGLFFQYSSVAAGLRKAVEILYEDPIEEVERKQMIASGILHRTGAEIRKLEKESQRIDRPDS